MGATETETEELTPDARAALLGELRERAERLLADLERAWYDDVTPGEVRALALRMLRATAGGGDVPRAELRFDWHAGCHCHGATHDERVDGDGPAALGTALARHAHGRDASLGDAAWVVPLSHAEQDRVRAAFGVEQGRLAALAAAQEALAHARADAKIAARDLADARRELEARREELRPEAVVTRESRIAELERAEAAARAAYEAREREMTEANAAAKQAGGGT